LLEDKTCIQAVIYFYFQQLESDGN
jgi:hypothetical protein